MKLMRDRSHNFRRFRNFKLDGFFYFCLFFVSFSDFVTHALLSLAWLAARAFFIIFFYQSLKEKPIMQSP